MKKNIENKTTTKMKIKQKTQIENHVLFLNGINEIIKKQDGKVSSADVRALGRSISMSGDMAMLFAVKQGVFSKLSRGIYKSNYDHIEPIIARKVCQARQKYYLDYNKKRKAINHVNGKAAQTSQLSFLPVRSTTAKRRSVSILWGLLKVSY